MGEPSSAWQGGAFAKFVAGFLLGCSVRGAEGGGTKRSGTCVVSGAVVVSPAAAQCASRSTAGDDIPRHNFIIN